MTACQNCGALDARPYRYSIGQRTKNWCDECAAAASRLGANVMPAERRVEDIPVIRERRHFRPRWLTGLRAKDMTVRAA